MSGDKRVLPPAYLAPLCPCRNCADRHPGCRSGCAAWREWSAAWTETRHAIRSGRKAGEDISLQSTAERCQKYRQKQKNRKRGRS